ncbi:hypothetical protein [Bacillus methanolicus]|uniref:hypothetical protein n=1 Tax=Bacillus methanolicus TaxID=1471 RepID=UPI002380283A|nr:hypothetical protein [Bacillus methanolicus]
MFNENSVVVQAWVRKIREGAVTFDDVPALSNLRDIVRDILDHKKGEEANV